MEVSIGGNRLGSGNKMKAELRTYERSTHDLSYVWRSTMASGTLVPFMTEVALPGDTFDIELECSMLTHPTIGPLFGMYKVQLDVFQIPIRLYQGELHMNMLGIGRDMSKIMLPQLAIAGDPIDISQPIDNQQINPSCIFSYLGIRGNGQNSVNPTFTTIRNFNAIPYLGYWDIYKNYYANKQEEIGAVIHKDTAVDTIIITAANITEALPPIAIPIDQTPPFTYITTTLNSSSVLSVTMTGMTDAFDINQLLLAMQFPDLAIEVPVRATSVFQNWEIDVASGTAIGTNPLIGFIAPKGYGGIGYIQFDVEEQEDTEPEVVTFPLSNIDDMRVDLLQWTGSAGPFIINASTPAPYGLPFAITGAPPNILRSQLYGQEGLALKTYNSDLFNNWISTEWIDGPDGVSAVTAIDTSGGSFTIDELNLSKKIYDMLNRIAISGGSYDDWLDAVYTHDRIKSAESPIYLGGLIKNLVFQEVVSNSRAVEQPLGTLAGRGVMGNKHKGGKIIAKVDEPSYLMGIISITPHVDYSQGNKWDTNLKTMNDFHKPALDQIGFQDLITDQMAWFDTNIDGSGNPIFKSAGKQPAWINYMTNVDVIRGNFADVTQQMFMVLNRRYQPTRDVSGYVSIKDVTTYIDPSKFNHIFADTRRDAQNFWAQVGVNIQARRKMSAKVIPNL